MDLTDWMKKRKIRTYSELIQLPTFEERFEYLKLSAKIGDESFGFDRYLYQEFLQTNGWKQIRNKIIIRDNACDLAHPDRQILNSRNLVIHHMNPVGPEDVLTHSDFLLNPEFLICTLDITHQAIHYSNSDMLMKEPVQRLPRDTCPWRKN